MQIIDDLEKLIGELREEDPRIEAGVDIIRYRSSVEISKEEKVIKTIMEAVRRILGKYPEFRGMISPADSEYLVSAGIPSVMFGPGCDRLAHASNEWIAIDDILTAVKVYAAIMLGDEIN